MADDDRRKDIILAPNEWLHVRDNTKGEVNVYVGPTKVTMGEGDKLVIFDEKSKKFIDVPSDRAIHTFVTAPEGYYIVLKNPAYNDKGEHKHPTSQGKVSPADLHIGRKINITGPSSFPLFPGQMAKVIKGHNLRSNQYLLVRVYDDEAAKRNWDSGVVKTQTDGDAPKKRPVPDITMGKLLVIKGTEVAFYIPPTGVEVVPDSEGNLVRSAVTLERLEYCLLRGENGSKRYEQGPQVVFPEPTEIFHDREVEKDGKKSKTRKFRAIELNENSGIYLKVIADYTESDATERKQGEELFVTGKQQMIYFPREEHAIIKYASSDGIENEIHYGIAIPKGEARYVLDRKLGEITIVKGPQIFLPDPRHQVIVRRLLDFKTCSILYPNNSSALEHNANVAGVDMNTYVTSSEAIASAAAAALLQGPMGATGAQGAMGTAATANPIFGGVMMANYGNAPGVFAANLAVSDTAQARGLDQRAGRGFSGDTFIRGTNYTEPRSITLPTKFDGVVSCDIWSGYAMMLVSKSGGRRVVQGPQTALLEYDEHPQILALSRGKPKTTDNILRTAYLLTRGNKVSDIVEVETEDFCKLRVKVSYRVNFEGADQEKWFSIENYTKFLTDHLRSKLRSAAKKVTVQAFYGGAEDFVRDTILGKVIDPTSGKIGRRGTLFEENNMHVYDVEVLNVELDDKGIAQELTNSQKEVIKHALTLQSQERALEFTKRSEEIKQQQAEAVAATTKLQIELKQRELETRTSLDMATLEANSKTNEERARQVHEAEEARIETEKLTQAAEKNKAEQQLALKATELEQKKDWLRTEAQAFIEQHQALDENLAAALNAFGERALVEKAAEALAPLAMVKGSGVLELLAKFLDGTNLAKHLGEVGKNGTAAKVTQPRA